MPGKLNIIFLSVLWLLFTFVPGRAEAPGDSVSAAKLLILNPVDLKTGAASETMGDELRSLFDRKEAWNTLDKKTIIKEFSHYSRDWNKPCKELTCAFDAGSLLQADYCIYSTIIDFQSYYIFTLSLLSMSATKVVWSRVGEVPIKAGDDSTRALVNRFEQLTGGLTPMKISSKAVGSKGVLGILDINEPSDYTKILFERLSTHAYTTGQYDILGQEELGFLMESLNIQASKTAADKDTMLTLGEKLGLDHLIYFQLNKVDKIFKLRMALFDIQKKKLLRDWPYKSSKFRNLLEFEDKFFSTLNKVDATPGAGGIPLSRMWKLAARSVMILAGGTFGVMSYLSQKEADYEYRKYQDANTAQELERQPEYKDNVETAERNRNIYGALGGVMIAGSVVLWVF